MSLPIRFAQSAVLPAASPFARFLVLRAGVGAAAQLPLALRELAAVRARLAQEEAAANPLTAIAFSADCWQKLGGELPAGWHALQADVSGQVPLPAEAADIFLHVRSDRFDFCYELVQAFLQPLTGLVEVLDERAGFRYRDSRDFTGFIDGTENPESLAERAEAALLDEGDFAGSSFVFAQRYVHKLARWNRLEVAEQEQVIGRTKTDSIELDEDLLPENSHIARNIIEQDGEELAILRHSLPYGEAGGDHGLFFLAYTRDLSIIDRMLARMFGCSGDGVSDRLLEFVTPVGGAYFFAPSESQLAKVTALS